MADFTDKTGDAAVSTHPPSSYNNIKRTSPSNSISLRHGYARARGAIPHQIYATPPTFRHAPPNVDIARFAPSDDSAARPDIDFAFLDSHQSRDADISSADTSVESLQKSNPEVWFQTWDKRLGENIITTVQDDDPPYFQPLTHAQKQGTRGSKGKPEITARDSDSSPYKVGGFSGYSSIDSRMILDDQQNLAINSLFPYLPLDQKSDDGFRGVIDDLTIKNKKLKQKLKKMDRIHCGDMNDEKLFEVRFHGLPDSKKSELEALLRQFAANLNEPTPTTNCTSGSGPTPNTKQTIKPTTHPDSAYATETHNGERSGTHSISHSTGLQAGISVANKSSNKMSTSSPHTVRFNATTHEPNERIKMKMVVKRLEQLFTGKTATEPWKSSTQVQQGISYRAAEDDRRGHMNMGLDEAEEGTREAALMTWQEDSAMATAEDTPYNLESPTTDEGDINSVADQRPTRPLDLDLQRSQIPAENLEYLNHITSSSLQKYPAPRIVNEDEVSNWVYLNLITNLAQLHTLNVSLPFIKRAIGSVSTKLELSSDSKKIRWKGGNVGSKFSSDSDTDNSSPEAASARAFSASLNNERNKITDTRQGGMVSNDSGVGKESGSGLKRRSASRSDVSGEHRSKSLATRIRNAAHEKFHYRPMFNRTRPAVRAGTSDSDCSISSIEQSSGSEVDDPGLTGRPNQSARDGPVIFFGGASFCTDLSSQSIPEPHVIVQSRSPPYRRYIEKPLGPSPPASASSRYSIDRPLLNSELPHEDSAMDLDMDFPEFIANPESVESLTKASPEPHEFSYIGLGGTHPDDNFMIHVRTKRAVLLPSHQSSQTTRIVKIQHRIPRSSLNVFLQSQETTAQKHQVEQYSQQVVSTETTKLAPSKMPSPSYVFRSTSDDDSSLTISTTSSAVAINLKCIERSMNGTESTDSEDSYRFPIDLDGGCDSDSEASGWSSTGNERIDLDAPVLMDTDESATAIFGSSEQGARIPTNTQPGIPAHPYSIPQYNQGATPTNPYASSPNRIIHPMNDMYIDQPNGPRFQL